MSQFYMVDWGRKLSADDPQWVDAENACYWIAARNGWQHLQGHHIGEPWIVNPVTDKVVAYRGSEGRWVGWYRGGPIEDVDPIHIEAYLSAKAPLRGRHIIPWRSKTDAEKMAAIYNYQTYERDLRFAGWRS